MADDWGMDRGSLFGDTDLFLGHLYGENLAKAGHIGSLQGEVQGLESSIKQLRAWITDIATTAGFLSSDDAGLRAVIKAQHLDLRAADAFNQMLIKDNRDKLYGASHEEFLENFLASGSSVANGWEQHLANRYALYAIINKMNEALAQANPTSRMLSEESRYQIYAESFNAQMDRYDRREFNGAGVNRKGLGTEDGLSGMGLRKKAAHEAADKSEKEQSR